MANIALQSILTQSKCWNQCATEKQLLAALTYLTGQILLALDPMADVNLQTVLNDSACWNQCATEKQLIAATAYLQFLIENTGGGGGGGAIGVIGENYCFKGANPNQIFQVVNLDTGLANRLDTVNPNPTVTLVIGDGDTC